MQQASLAQRWGLKILVLLAYVSLFFFLVPLSWQLFWLVTGVVCGVAFLLADESYAYRWYQEKSSSKPRFLVSRSPLFLLSLIPLTIFVLTSSGSFWASGMMGGMTLFVLLEMTELRRDPAAFDKRFLPTIKGQVSPQHIQFILLGGWTFFALIHLLVML
jgi:hypothetical protein